MFQKGSTCGYWGEVQTQAPGHKIKHYRWRCQVLQSPCFLQPAEKIHLHVLFAEVSLPLCHSQLLVFCVKMYLAADFLASHFWYLQKRKAEHLPVDLGKLDFHVLKDDASFWVNCKNYQETFKVCLYLTVPLQISEYIQMFSFKNQSLFLFILK